MDNSHNNTGLFPQMPICEEVLHAEVGNDFTLPDYKSEIRKLLSTKVKLMAPQKYIGNNGANLEGQLVYKILYIGADGSLYCATLNDKYRFDATFDYGAHSLNPDDVMLECFCECESVNTRVLGPRKLNVKSRLSCRFLALSPALYTPTHTGAHDKSSIENLIMEAPSLVVKNCESESITLTEFISTDQQIDTVRIIDSISNVMISECSPAVDKINVRGEVFLKLIYCNDAQSEDALTMIRRLPFSSSILCEGVTNSHECCAHGVISEEDIRMDDNGINIELTLTLYAHAQKNEAVSYVYDAFSTESSVENSTEEITLNKALKALNGNLSLNETFSLSEMRIDPNAKVIDIEAKAHLHSFNVENGKVVLLGECYYQVVFCLNGEYSAYEFTSPLRYELDLRTALSEYDLKLLYTIANVISSHARSDGERLFIDCEVNFCLSLYAKHKIVLLKEMTLGEKLLKSTGEMTLCYPSKNSSLWSVAKQYGIPVQKLRDKNGLSENDGIFKRKYLVI